MENTVRSRLLEYLDARKLSISAFEKSMGFSNGSISKFLRGDQQTIGVDKIEHILNIDESLNSDWLMRGKGEMYNKRPYPGLENKVSIVEESAGRMRLKFEEDESESVEQIIGEFSNKMTKAMSRINQRMDEMEKRIKNGT